MHCHLGFSENARKLASEADAKGLGGLSVTVTPCEYERLTVELAPCECEHPAAEPMRPAPGGGVCEGRGDNADACGVGVSEECAELGRSAIQEPGSNSLLRVGLGMHPWWVADGRCGSQDMARFKELASRARFVGEVGLDFSSRWEFSRDTQLAAFEGAVDALMGADCSFRKVISLHAVQAAGSVMDVLEERGAFERHACIFHWFSGTSDELQRAIKRGCFFSIGERMLATKRGKAYAQAIPLDRLLLETDYPEETNKGVAPDRLVSSGELEESAVFREWRARLERALSLLAQVRGEDEAVLAARLEENSLALLR
ncbi:MAG: TatD family hydrolase [Eggerthellaceae bacterium]|nr:TatD family hydrolase [Eggerthellaceae bacterium]